MSLQMPNLDDRTFDQLLKAALEWISKDLNTDWNDFSPGDPGKILLETFAFLTEQMIYRLNRVPEKVYIAFLRMMGVGLRPPSAARVKLSFWQEPAGENPVTVKRGTQVSTEQKGENAVIFSTAEDLVIPPGATRADPCQVAAYQATWVEEELPVKESVEPGQIFTVSRPPILAWAKGLEICLGVEIDPNDKQKGNEWPVPIPNDSRRFEAWEEVEHFANVSPAEKPFRVDRQAGTIQFAPGVQLYEKARAAAAGGVAPEKAALLSEAPLADAAPPAEANENAGRPNGGSPGAGASEKRALAALPRKGAAIRVRYPVGGGSRGNLRAGTLTALQDPALAAQGIKVTNEEDAHGGMDSETLENAMLRGPQEIFTHERLITARDFERCVLSSWSDIARARAYAMQDLWEHGRPGTVCVNLVPAMHETEYMGSIPHAREALENKQAMLDRGGEKEETERLLASESPLGVHVRLGWTRYKCASVHARITVPQGMDIRQVEQRLKNRLYSALSPLPPPGEQGGWAYGAPLKLGDISRWILDSAREIKLRSLSMSVDCAPDSEIPSLAADYFQARTWYAASGQRLFRTTNDAAGWEELLDFSPGKANAFLQLRPGMQDPPGGQVIKKVCPCRHRAGLVALAAQGEPGGSPRGYVYLSADCGESWLRLTDINAEIDDMDWLEHAGKNILLLATSTGLQAACLEFNPCGLPALGGMDRLAVIAAENTTFPVYAVKVLEGQNGAVRLAAAAGGRCGVYLSDGADLPLDISRARFAPLAIENTGPLPPDIRCLGVQWFEQQSLFLLWAGGMAVGSSDLLKPVDPEAPDLLVGDLPTRDLATRAGGCCYWAFDGKLNDWKPAGGAERAGHWWKEGWNGGSCLKLAFLGNRVLAATARATVLAADVQADKDAPEAIRISPWSECPDQDPGHPLPKARFQGLGPAASKAPVPFTAIASNDRLKKPAGRPLALAGYGQGIFRSDDRGRAFEKVSWSRFYFWNEAITIPPGWLIVSGEHEIIVEHEVAADGSRTPQEGSVPKEGTNEGG